MSEGDRHLAAIMFTDMVGYTALGQRDESLSLALVEEQRKLVRPTLGRHGGREVKTIGDAFLVEFPNAIDAVRCAYDIQRSVREYNFSLPVERRIHLRIGVHVGEVIGSEGDIMGDAVNVASRIEPLAEDGGVCLSRQAYDNVRNKVDLPLSSLGPKSLKNVAEPMEVFRVEMPWAKEATGSREELDKKRIAVLPFTNLSSAPEEGYFADGITEELITSLSGVHQLTVIARTSVMRYRDSKKGASEIGRELSVGSLLEGSVRKAGTRVRITAQLIDTVTEGHLWAQNYDRELDDVFAIQSEIAQKVAEELRIRLVDEERRAIDKRATENTDAYTLFLRSRELVRSGGEPSIRKAIRLLEDAVQLDPSFARAYSELATCRLILGNAGYEPWEAAIAAAKPPLRRAMECDPELAEAHSTLSYLMFSEDDCPGAEAEAKRAIELNPSLPDGYDLLSNVEAVKGNLDESVRLTEICYRLDPVRPKFIYDLGLAYFYSGREKEAIEHWNRTDELAPGSSDRAKAEYFLWKGDVEQARRLHSTVMQTDPNREWVKWMGGFLAARSGNRDSALLEIRKVEESKGGALSLNSVGFIYYALGDLDSYFARLREAMELHALDIGHAFFCPLFAQARADPRYDTLWEDLQKMNGLQPRRPKSA